MLILHQTRDQLAPGRLRRNLHTFTRWTSANEKVIYKENDALFDSGVSEMFFCTNKVISCGRKWLLTMRKREADTDDGIDKLFQAIKSMRIYIRLEKNRAGTIKINLFMTVVAINISHAMLVGFLVSSLRWGHLRWDQNNFRVLRLRPLSGAP